MNDNYVKFEFDIQFLHTCHESNGDSVYTVSVYKIYSKKGNTKGNQQYIYIYIYIFRFNW